MSSIREEARRMKLAAPHLAAAPIAQRNAALENIANELEKHQVEIFQANALDLQEAMEEGIAPAIQKRLKYDAVKMRDSIAGLRELEKLEDPVGKTLLLIFVKKDMIGHKNLRSF